MTAIVELSRGLVKQIKETYPGLAWLDLSGNAITKLENLEPLVSLSGVDVSRNSLAVCDLSALGCLPALETLVAAHNEIVTVIECQTTAPPLQVLDLSFCRIESINSLKGIECLSKTLKELKIMGNPLANKVDTRLRIAESFPWLDLLDGVPLSPVASTVSLGRTSDTPSAPPEWEISTQERQMRKRLDKKIGEFEKARRELQEERLAMEKERALAAEILQQLEEERCRHPDNAVAGTQTIGGNVGSQTDSNQTASAACQTETLTCVTSASQTDETLETEKRKYETKILGLEKHVMEQRQQLEEAQKTIEELRQTVRRLQDLEVEHHRKESKWHEEKKDLMCKLGKKGVDLESRAKAMEALLLAQERAVLNTDQMKNKEEGALLKTLVVTWRKKVFQVLTQQEASKILASRAADAVEQERRDLQEDINRLHSACFNLTEENGKAARDVRDAKLECQRLQASLLESNHQLMSAKQGLQSLASLWEKKSRDLLASVCSRIDSFSTRLQLVESSIPQVHTSLIKQQQELTVKSSTLISALDKVEREQTEQRALRAENETLREEAKSLEGKVSQAMSQVDSLNIALKESKQRAEEELSRSLQGKEEELNEKLRQVMDSRDAVSLRLSDALQKVRELENTLLRTQSRMEQEASAKVATLEDRLYRREMEANSLRRERNALLNTLRDAERKGLLPGFGLVRSHLGGKPRADQPKPDEDQGEEQVGEEDEESDEGDSVAERLQGEEDLAMLAARLLDQEERQMKSSSKSEHNKSRDRELEETDEEEDDDDVLEMLVLEAVRRTNVSR